MDVLAGLAEVAQERGYKPGMFSFNSGEGRCPACGGNLDITYDYAAIEPDFGAGAGMFRSDSLLPCADPGSSLPLTIGATPLHRARRLGRSAGLENVWLKDESGNPSSSIKDRASAVALLRAAERDAVALLLALAKGTAGNRDRVAHLGLHARLEGPQPHHRAHQQGQQGEPQTDRLRLDERRA